MTQPPPAVTPDTPLSMEAVRLVVSTWIQAMQDFAGDRYQEQLAEVVCIGIAWSLEDRIAGVNAPDWPSLSDDLLGKLVGSAPAGFAESLRKFQGFEELAAGIEKLAGEEKIDLPVLAKSFRCTGELVRRVTKMKPQA